MFSPFNRLSFTSSNKMVAAVLSLSLVAVGTAVYLSPTRHPAADVVTAISRPVTPPQTTAELAATAARELAAKNLAMAKFKGTGKKSPTGAKPTPTVIHAPAKTDVVVVKVPTNSVTPSSATQVAAANHTASAAAAATHTATVAASVRLLHCSDFKWQQDAQAGYLANLSDPGALDGAVGPHNGDGLACNNLPADPSRAASAPVDAYVAPVPTAASKATLVTPAAKYFGIAQDGLPGDVSMFDQVDVKAGKAPSAVGWFSGFDTDYRSDQVTAAWSRGALPMLTWMSVAASPGSGHNSSEYTLSKIASGAVDPYLLKYAGDIVRTNLPVVIRFDHEMNNNTYPWSAGMYYNTPALYVAAWQHIWNLFQSVGANNDVIWLWAPSRIDNLKPHATSGAGVGQTDLAEDYPGDAYVDWVGASIYLRAVKTGPTYTATFGKTISALEALTSKPVYIPETGSVETDSATGTDVAALKSAWITNAFAGFLADPRIVGFTWFNNPGTQTVNGVPVTNDWRFDSSAAALTAFQDGVADKRFAAGTAPDGR